MIMLTLLLAAQLVGDCQTDNSTELQRMLDNSSFDVVYVPPGCYKVNKPVVIRRHGVKLRGEGTLEKVGPGTLLKVGEYQYAPNNPPWDYSQVVYFTDVSGLTFVPTTTALELRGSFIGNFRDLRILGGTDQIIIGTVSHWNRLNGIATVLGNRSIVIDGMAHHYDENSTGNIISNIQMLGFSYVGIHAYGTAFGDLLISNVSGAGTNAFAGIRLDGIGSAYSAKIGISNVDIDGSVNYGIYATGTHQLRVNNLATGGAVIVPKFGF